MDFFFKPVLRNNFYGVENRSLDNGKIVFFFFFPWNIYFPKLPVPNTWLTNQCFVYEMNWEEREYKGRKNVKI